MSLFAAGCGDEGSVAGPKANGQAPETPSSGEASATGPAAAPAAAPAQAPSRLFVVGGDEGFGATKSVMSAELEADGSLGELRAEADLPAARAYGSAVLSNHSLVVIGGEDETGRADERIFASAPTEDNLAQNWRDVGVLDHPASSAAIASNGVDVMVLGGELTGETTRLLDGATKLFLDSGVERSVTRVAPLPSARARFGAVRVGGNVFAVGGETDAGPVSDVLFGRIAADKGTVESWATTHPFAHPVVDHALVASGDSLYAIGGSTGDAIEDEVRFAHVFDAGYLSEWFATSRLPSPRYAHCAAVSGSHIFVVGGMSADRPIDEILETTAHLDGSVEPWRVVGHLPAGRAHMGCVVR
ncbi:MAG TPA: hypothetical protein VIF62_20880 [Labilithrix sp.]